MPCLYCSLTTKYILRKEVIMIGDGSVYTKSKQNSKRWNRSLAWEFVHLLVFNQIKAFGRVKKKIGNDCLHTSCRDATTPTRKTVLKEFWPLTPQQDIQSPAASCLCSSIPTLSKPWEGRNRGKYSRSKQSRKGWEGRKQQPKVEPCSLEPRGFSLTSPDLPLVL